MFRPSQDSSVMLVLMSRVQLMLSECSKHQELSFAKMLVVWWTNEEHPVLISVLESAQWINSEFIYPEARVSSFPALIGVARVNEYRTTDVTTVLKAPGAELCQNACGVVNEQKAFCSHHSSPECSMNKFRAYISTYTCFVLPRTHRCGLG